MMDRRQFMKLTASLLASFNMPFPPGMPGAARYSHPQVIGTSPVNTTSFTIPLPSGYKEGDLLLAAIGTDKASIPSGWSLAAKQEGATVIHKIAGEAEGPLNLSIDEAAPAVMYCIRGVDQEAPVEIVDRTTAEPRVWLAGKGEADG